MTAILAALPAAAHLIPVGSSDISAQTLLSRIRNSADVGYSGYAQSRGGLDLPVSTGDLSTTGNLLGASNQLRVWWRGAQDWRVDTLSLTGETDLHADSTGIWSWDYESDTARLARTVEPAQPLPALQCQIGPTNTRTCQIAPNSATYSGAPSARLPRDDDLLPGNLARRLLSEADDSTATRIGSVRLAGHSAAGLRITVADPRSTISHIDVWALPGDGLPLRVEVFGVGSHPVVSTTLLDVSIGTPPAQTTAFTPPDGAKVRYSSPGDLVSALDNFGSIGPPDEVAGLARRRDLDLGAVGVYGRGVMELAVLPVSHSLARQIVPSLDTSTGTANADAPVSVGAGAVNLLLSAPSRRGNRWLLVGTVTPATLRSALAGLPSLSGFGFPRPHR